MISIAASLKTKLPTITIVSLVSFITIFTIALAIFSINEPANATVSGSNFKAGSIIDDGRFYNNNTMNVQDIQTFLNQKVTNCDTNGTQKATERGSNLTHAQYAASRGWAGPPYICLKNYYQVPRSDQVISNFNGNVIPSGGISAATIIKTAADTHGVNPEVLLVMIQKESQNLLNDNWPVISQYTNAMGYGCPDTAGCDPQYAGFYNQMMNAARQFKLYKTNPNSYRYKPLQNNTISYQANNTSCGTSSVYLSNYATAGLYNYTPYQPNQPALNNMYGTGDACSAYGNRNFWRDYSDWFGDTKSYLTTEAVGSVFNIRNEANTYYTSVIGTSDNSLITTGVCYQQGSDYLINGIQSNMWVKITQPVAGWVPTDAALYQKLVTTPNLQACNYSVTPVYRAYNPHSEEHLWTQDANEITFVKQNLRFGEGGATFFATTGGNYSGKPVFRLYNKAKDTHFLTADPSERDFVKSQLGFIDEGYAFSIPYTDAGSKPVWRLYNPAKEIHFWTADPNERDFVVNQLRFRLEGQAFRAPQ